MKRLMMLCMVLAMVVSVNAATVLLNVDSNFKDAANWDNGLPTAGNDGTISINCNDGAGTAQNDNWAAGATVTFGGGATVTWGIDLSANGGATLIVNDATLNCADDVFVQGGGTLILNAGSVTTAGDDWEANNNAGRIIVNGGTHSSGSGTGGNLGAQGTATKIGCGIDFLGGTVTAGNFRFQVNSDNSVGGSAVLNSAGASTTFSDAKGAIDILLDWTGLWEVGSFGVGDWEALVTSGTNGFKLGGAAIDATSFANDFVVSEDGTTLSLANPIPEPATMALLGLGGMLLGLKRKK